MSAAILRAPCRWHKTRKRWVKCEWISVENSIFYANLF